jgi:hypothetical protein
MTVSAIDKYNAEFYPLGYNLMSLMVARAVGCERDYVSITNPAEAEHNRIMNIFINAGLSACGEKFYPAHTIITAACEAFDLSPAVCATFDVWMSRFQDSEVIVNG